MTLNVGLIGCGGITHSHVEGWKKVAGRAEIVAMADISESNARARMAQLGRDVSFYEDYHDLLADDQIDVVMCVMNYADRNIYDFESKVLPEARRRNVGCVAMKVYVGIKGGFRNHRSGHVGCVTKPDRMPHAMSYALDLEGVSVAVVGPYTVEQSIRNVEIAQKYKPLSAEQRNTLLEYGRKLAPTLGPRYGSVV